LAHCTTRLIDPTHRGTYRRYTNNCIYLSIYLSISKFWVKDKGVSTKVAFAIQNQR